MKNIYKNIALLLVVLATIVLVFVGCSDMMSKMVEVVLKVEAENTIRTYVKTYSVIGTLENSKSSINLVDLIPSEDVVIPNISPGKWTFTVNAYDDNKVLIGSGTKDVILVEGRKVDLKIPVVFIPLKLTISDPDFVSIDRKSVV